MRPIFTKCFSLFVSICCTFVYLPLSPAFAREVAGTVISATRAFAIAPPTARDPKSEPRPLKVKDKIYTGDIIHTHPKKGGSLCVLMRDGTSISLGGTSAFEIQTYAADGPTPTLMGRMFGSIIRIITGKIAKMNPEGTVIQTPHATVGIRGTDCILRFNESENTTEVFVLYSMRDVLLNGTPIKSGQKGIVGKRGDIPAVGIVTPEEKQKLNRLVPAARGADMSDIDKSITTENFK